MVNDRMKQGHANCGIVQPASMAGYLRKYFKCSHLSAELLKVLLSGLFKSIYRKPGKIAF